MSGGTVWPVLIETHGKQAFIFATGKRREAVGASYLVHAVTDWARDALGPVGVIGDGAGAELVVATSGTVLAFVTDRERAVGTVRATTGRALREAPGLGVTGVVGEPFVWDEGGAPAAVAAVFAEMGRVRTRLPGPTARFPVLPVTALCPSSGLPVAGFAAVGGTPEPRSQVCLGALNAVEPALARLEMLTGIGRNRLRAATELLGGEGTDAPKRVAVVHADGNGLGRLVTRLAEILDVTNAARPDTAYAAGYRAFSEGLDEVTRLAWRWAVDEVSAATGREPLVLPLIVGGDDLTFTADAQDAPALTACFQRRFVEEAARTPGVAGPVASASEVGDPRLGIAAGIVVCAPHFPFSAAYELAEELLTDVGKQAKARMIDESGRPVPCVSLASHVQQDTTGTTNAQRVASLTSDGRLLSGAPYVTVVPHAGVERTLSEEALAWSRGRDLVTDLFGLARRFSDTVEGRRVLPSAQVHELRRRLRPVPAAADEYLRRLPSGTWRFLAEDDGLFTDRGVEPATTRFLDALTLSPYAGPAIEGVTA